MKNEWPKRGQTKQKTLQDALLMKAQTDSKDSYLTRMIDKSCSVTRRCGVNYVDLIDTEHVATNALRMV